MLARGVTARQENSSTPPNRQGEGVVSAAPQRKFRLPGMLADNERSAFVDRKARPTQAEFFEALADWIDGMPRLRVTCEESLLHAAHNEKALQGPPGGAGRQGLAPLTDTTLAISVPFTFSTGWSVVGVPPQLPEPGMHFPIRKVSGARLIRSNSSASSANCHAAQQQDGNAAWVPCLRVTVSPNSAVGPHQRRTCLHQPNWALIQLERGRGHLSPRSAREVGPPRAG